MSGFIDLLDFGNPFEKISVRILEIGEEHVSRPVTSRSVNPSGAAVTKMDKEFRQLGTPWKIEGGVLQPASGQRDEAEIMMVRVAAEKGHQMRNSVRHAHAERTIRWRVPLGAGVKRGGKIILVAGTPNLGGPIIKRADSCSSGRPWMTPFVLSTSRRGRSCGVSSYRLEVRQHQ